MPHLPPAGSGTIAPSNPAPAFQEHITFNVTGTDGLDNPRVWVTAHQDGVLVYGEGSSPDDGVTLGSGWSQWVENGGGPADCTATLYYILGKSGNSEWKGGGQAQGGTVTLATVSFHAAG